MKPVFPPETEARILHLEQGGMSHTDIANELGVARIQITNLLYRIHRQEREEARKRLKGWPEGITFEDVDEMTLRREAAGYGRAPSKPVGHTIGGVARYG